MLTSVTPVSWVVSYMTSRACRVGRRSRNASASERSVLATSPLVSLPAYALTSPHPDPRLASSLVRAVARPLIFQTQTPVLQADLTCLLWVSV